MPSPSNGIGEFIIDVNQTLISQYANSPIIYQLVQNLSSYFEPAKNLDNFFDAVFNIDLAVGDFLDAWGRVVGISRVLPVSVGDYFGFHEQTEAETGGFNQAPFYNGEPLPESYFLSDSAYRLLILIKAAFNLTDCTIQSINQLLLSLFPNRGACYIVDNQDMTMVYTFDFLLTPVEQSIVVNSGVLPRPSGVKVSYSY